MNVQTTQPEPDWFITAFGEHYPLVYHHRDDASARREAAGAVELLGLTGGERVLDICCGAGRHAEAMAEAGFDVMGVDLSEPLLAEAERRPRLAGRLVRADVRALPFENEFDAATNLFTSFGYFESDDENRAALRQMAKVLRPGGRLLMDHANRDHVVANLVPEDTRAVGGMAVHNRRSIEGDRVVKRTTCTHADGSINELIERVRLFTPDEIAAWFAGAGLAVTGIFGSMDGEPFDEGKPRMIVVGVRS